MGRKCDHPATKYAKAVLSGKIVAGKWVKLACQRHLDDLARDDIYFDEDSADRFIEACSYLKHSKGEWAGSSFVLGDWEIFIVSNIFGGPDVWVPLSFGFVY